MTEDDVDTALFYAFRYALGRSTYAVSDVCTLINKYKYVLHERTKDKIREEIIDADREDRIGMGMDRDEWMELLGEL